MPAVWLATVVGCGPKSAEPPVVATNLVTVVREVTNLVVETKTVAVTNVVVERREPPRQLTARKTAPYLVSSRNLGADQLRGLLAAAGARVVSCEAGAVAVVEAPDKVVGGLRTGGVMTVSGLAAEDKFASDLAHGASPQAVRIHPLSLIDLDAVAGAVRELGGELRQVVARGTPVVRAKISGQCVGKLAERADVRLIERDNQ